MAHGCGILPEALRATVIGGLKILLISEPGVDGVFRHVEGLTHFLIAKGHQVYLAYSDRRGSAALDELVTFVRERGGRCLNLRVSNAPHPRDLAAFRGLNSFARSLHPDVIHSHSSKAGALGRTLALLRIPARYFYTPHAYYGLASRSGPRAGFFNFVERLLGRIGTTINISQDEAAFSREVLRIPRCRQRIIHNPVADIFFTPTTPQAKASARAELKIPDDVMVFGTVGRLAEQKDPVTLYRAFAELTAEFPRLLLVHLGEGPLKSTILRLVDDLRISEKVRLLDYRDDPLTVYQSLDLFAMSSRYEAGWPISILEAMAQNLPIVTTDCPGCRNIASEPLSHCWTAGVGDVQTLTDAMRAALLDQFNPRACNHREIALSRFSVGYCYGAIIDAYREAQ